MYGKAAPQHRQPPAPHSAYAAGDLSSKRHHRQRPKAEELRIHDRSGHHPQLRRGRRICRLSVHTAAEAISDAIIKYSYVPVFCGVGGGTTRGLRTVQLARDVESQGAMGVVLNAPINNLNLRAVSGVIDIPTVITVTKFGTDFEARIEAGASILNIAAAAQTPELVREARKALPDVPIIATGGKTGESILRTIEAGANAITYTPPSTYELFQEMMKGYRE